jgi:hypothetical protein
MSAKDPAVKVQVMEAVYTSTSYSGVNKVAGIKLLRTLTGTSLKEAKDLCEVWMEQYDADPTSHHYDSTTGTHTFNIDDEVAAAEATKAKAAPVYADPVHSTAVPLREATQLHQRIKGTDSSSVYHVIAIGRDVIVAARIKNNHNVAIRAEIIPHHASKAAQAAQKGLIFAGLDKKNGGHYSLHLDAPDFNMVKRSIGSILFATEINFDGVSTSMSAIQGEGA